MITVKVDGMTLHCDDNKAVRDAIKVLEEHADNEYIVRYFEDMPDNVVELCRIQANYENGLGFT